MELGTKKPFRLQKWLVALLWLSCAALAANLLYEDFNLKPGQSSGEPIAVVQSVVSNVRRKPAHSFLWTVIHPGSALYKKDSLQASEESSAVIQFPDGSELEIGEESLVVLEDNLAVNLNFMRGNFLVRQGKRDKQIIVQKGKKKESVPLVYRLTYPESAARFFVFDDGKINVRFKWAELDKSDQTSWIEISKRSSFPKKRTQKKKIKAKQLEANLELGAGKFFWRIVGEKGTLSATRRFRVEKAKPVQPVFPTAVLSQWKIGSPVQFRWSIPQTLRREAKQAEHFLDISQEPSFETTLLTEPITLTKMAKAITGLSEGTFYWRVRSSFGEKTLLSERAKFNVRKAKNLRISLLNPARESVLFNPELIRFQWSSEQVLEKNKTHVVEIEEKKGRKFHPRAKETRTTSSFVWEKPTEGLYRWRVQVRIGDQAAGSSEWSYVSVFRGAPIALRYPPHKEKIFYWANPTSFNFQWKPDPWQNREGMRYRLDLAKDSTFDELVASRNTTENELAVGIFELVPGAYFWRVSLVDVDGVRIKPSRTQQFYYGHYPLLAAPQGLVPSEGQRVRILTKAATLSWQTVEEAQAYVVSISEGGRSVFKKTTKDNQLVLKEIGPGRYLWTVRAVDRLKREGQAAPLQELELTYGKRLRAPTIIDPMKQ